jgi:hypothetical protein
VRARPRERAGVTLRRAMAEREERSGTSTAAAAAEQVRAIVEAAERSAAALEAAAREDAARIRADAEAAASTTREAASRLTERADELERRLDDLTAGVRAAVDALKEDLAALRASGAGVAEPVLVEPVAAEPAAAEAGATEEPVAAEAAAEVDPTIAETEKVAAREPDVADEPASAAEREPSRTAPEGARVLALKMALDGTPRDETARYLRENFELEDPEALLDEVYARAGG